MSTRRDFIKNVGIHSMALTLSPLMGIAASDLDKIRIPEFSPHGDDEDFWGEIQQAYTSSRSKINLNNGGVSPQPKYVQDAFELYNAMSNEAPSYIMWRQLEPSRVNIREDLAKMLGCSREELVINRNTTEALDTIIFGLDLEKGDEIVLTKYDYPNMRNAWEQRKKRDGIVLKYVDISLPEASDEEIVESFVKEMGPKTKLVHITHMVNYNGQILPTAEIASEAKKKGYLVMVDGAHTFAHIPYKLTDFDCDFFGTSLHKWLCAPFGTGLMYVKKEHIEKIWPFFPTDAIEDNDIRKFEAMGTRSVPSEVAVGQAIVFHQRIGNERKFKRLQYLTDYWTSKVENHPNFISYNPKRENRYGSLFTFGIKGMKGNEISTHLLKKHQIVTSPILWQNLNGCRVSPHVYTRLSELDTLVKGINELLER